LIGRSAGWEAQIALSLEPRRGRTVLAQKRQQGPLTVQRAFHPEGAPCHLYLLHPPGGVVGGDRLRVEAELAPDAHTLFTAPGASKFYRSAGEMAELRQVFRVSDGAKLEWLPHESILFPGARLKAQTRVVLEGRARFFGWEILSLGRPVLGERFDPGLADMVLRIEREGRPLLSERLRVDADGSGQAPLVAASGLRGCPVSATLMATGAGPADLDAARDLLRPDVAVRTGMTLIEDVLVVRSLAHRVEPVLLGFRRLWQRLRPRLLGVEASSPRIWAT
jgi:urease accessory protein